MVDWSRAKWELQDVELAAYFSCSREAARQARLRYGVSPSIKARRRTVPTARAKLESMDTVGHTLRDLAKLSGCKSKYVAVILRKSGKGYRKLPRGCARYDWRKFPQDWLMKTDNEIGEIIGGAPAAVVNQWRNRHGFLKRARRSSKVALALD